MNPLAFLNPYRWLIYGGLALAVIFGGAVLKNRYDEGQRDIGRAEVQAKWDKERDRLKDQAIAEQKAKDDEGRRRLEIQQRNQDAQDRQLALAKAAAARATAAADRVREQSIAAARDWAQRLADSPTRQDLQTAASAIRVCTELLGRADARAGILAQFADASRAAGLKCERDYDSLAK